MDSHHGRPDDRLAILVHHASREGRRGHLRKGDNTRKHRDACEHKAFESVLHITELDNRLNRKGF